MSTTEKGLLEDYRGPKTAKEQSSNSGGLSKRQKEMLLTAHGTKNNFEQVMVKITSYGSGSRGVGSHIRYITRDDKESDKDKIPLKDSNGFELKEGWEIRDVIGEWKADFSRKQLSEREKVKVQFDFKSINEKENHFSDVRKWAKEEFGRFSRVFDGKGKTGEKRIYLTYEPEKGFVEQAIKEAEKKAELKFPSLKSTVTQLNERRERDTMHMMLSPAKGVDKEKVERIGMAFAIEEFKANGHDFVYVIHDDTDNPHMHLVVKMQNEYGKRLKTNKQDLHNWRIKYAEIARHYGLQVEASYRSDRGVGKKGESLTVNKIEKDGRTSWVKESQRDEIKSSWKNGKVDGSSSKKEPWEIAQLKKNNATRLEFVDAAKQILEQTKNVSLSGEEKRKLYARATILKNHAEEMPEPKTKTQEIHSKFDSNLANIRANKGQTILQSNEPTKLEYSQSDMNISDEYSVESDYSQYELMENCRDNEEEKRQNTHDKVDKKGFELGDD